MERPIMNPMFLEGTPQPPPPKRRGLGWAVFAILRGVFRLFTLDLCFWRRHSRLQVEDGAAWHRALRGLLYRLLFIPVIIFAVLSGIVWVGSHPSRTNPPGDPMTVGLYYDPVSFSSRDGTRLDGWMIPILDARKVIEQKEKAIKLKHPAVVLVHDHADNRTQVLPLARPLHDAGYVVFVVGLRGSDGGRSATTFGLREAEDVWAAVEVARAWHGVDSARVAVLGVGTGANAAMLAAMDHGEIAALVLDNPVTNIDEMLQEQLAPPQPWLKWARPLSKWIFEVAYRVDADDMDFSRCRSALKDKPMLLFDPQNMTSTALQRRGTEQARDFLDKHLKRSGSGVATTN